MIEFIEVGQTRKTHGYKGEIKIDIQEQYLHDILAKSVLFIKIKGNMVPFFIESIREMDSMLVKFDDIHTSEDAVELCNKTLFADKSYLTTSDLFTPTNARVEDAFIGYEIVDINTQYKVVIDRIEELPQQLMAVVQWRGKELYIPLLDQWIQTQNDQQKVLEMNLPDGIFEMHLENPDE